MSHVRTHWPAEFFRRHYRDPETRIHPEWALRREGVWLAYTVKHRLDVELTSALDLGSGTGEFADGLAQLDVAVRRIDLHAPDPRAERFDLRYVGLEGFDLIVCRDVLHYLTEADADCLLERMNRCGAPVLYLRASTLEDAPAAGSDEAIERRPAAWYRARLPDYAWLRFGLLVRTDLPVPLGALE